MISRVTVDSLNVALRGNPDVQLIDVRNRDDFADCFIRQAKNVPVSNFEQASVSLDKPVFLICKSGKLCDEVAAKLPDDADVRIVAGGMTAWEAQNFPVCWRYNTKQKLFWTIVVLVMSILLAYGTVHLSTPVAMQFALFLIIAVCGRSILADVCSVHTGSGGTRRQR